jgi:hypothetical protein
MLCCFFGEHSLFELAHLGTPYHCSRAGHAASARHVWLLLRCCLLHLLRTNPAPLAQCTMAGSMQGEMDSFVCCRELEGCCMYRCLCSITFAAGKPPKPQPNPGHCVHQHGAVCHWLDRRVCCMLRGVCCCALVVLFGVSALCGTHLAQNPASALSTQFLAAATNQIPLPFIAWHGTADFLCWHEPQAFVQAQGVCTGVWRCMSNTRCLVSGFGLYREGVMCAPCSNTACFTCCFDTLWTA